ncbi:MAG: hypothetical protein PHI73_03895 [Patescibacteria group bacterium]|nr:hypothetical protein [Patescibacteria group bacterium]
MNIQAIKKFLNRRNLFLIAVIGIIFFLGMRVPLDPDLGWHLRSGEYIWQHKAVATTDPFSHSFPEYPWIAHEWLSDLMLYGLNSLGAVAGPIAMSAVFAVFSTLAFYFAGRSFPARKEYQLLAALLALLVSLPIIGPRPQVISMLGLGLVFYFLYRFRLNQKSRGIYYLPLIFLVWVNLHGGFSLGLFALALFFGVELFRRVGKWAFEKIRKRQYQFKVLEKASLVKIMIIGLVSGAATLVNPYGLRIYYEVYYTMINTVGSALVRQSIAEWNPVQFGHRMSLQLTIYLVLFGILLLFSLKKIDFTHLIITGVFFYIGLSSWRHMPLLMIAITPFWVLIAQVLTGDTLLKLLRRRFILFLFLLALALVIRQQISGLLEFGIDPAKMSNKGQYPYEAVQYLLKHPLKGEMLNEYNYGGYLVWNYPQKKVFIDGRMAIWEYQGKNIYTDWEIIGQLKTGYLELIDKYKIDWTFFRCNLAIAEALRRSENWQEVYRDEMICIIVRRGSQE